MPHVNMQISFNNITKRNNTIRLIEENLRANQINRNKGENLTGWVDIEDLTWTCDTRSKMMKPTRFGEKGIYLYF